MKTHIKFRAVTKLLSPVWHAQAYCRLLSVISFNTQVIHTDHHQIQGAVNFPWYRASLKAFGAA